MEKKDRIYLAVPFSEKDQVKELGAKWDAEKKCWYISERDKIFDKWTVSTNKKENHLDENDIRREFLDATESAGLIINNLIADGKLHRVPVHGKSKGKDGAYKLHIDGTPAGFIQNFTTGFKENWTSQTKNKLNKENAKNQKLILQAKQAQSKYENELKYLESAKKAEVKFQKLKPASPNHKYLTKKKLDQKIIKELDIRQEDNKLVIALKNDKNKIQTLQNISENGFKSFEKDCKASEGFAIFGENLLEEDLPLIISTGMATSASIFLATKHPVVATFQDHNLKLVAKKFKQKFPKKEFIIAGDNDQHNVEKGLKNTGLESAKEVSLDIDAKLAIPIFQSNNNLTDFSDMHIHMGLESVKKQISLAKKILLTPKEQIAKQLRLTQKKDIEVKKNIDLEI